MSENGKPEQHSEDQFGGPVENPSKLPEWDPKSVEEDGPGSENPDEVTKPVTGVDPDIAPDPQK